LKNLSGTGIILFLVSFLAAKLLLPYFFDLLTHDKALKKNWHGKLIPGTAGVVFPVIISLVSLPLAAAGPVKTEFLIYLYAIFATAMLGLLDDIIGDSGPKGLKGHLGYLWRNKRISTGLVKAVGSGIITLWVVLYIKSVNIIIDWLLLLLTINLINLLDLRPGRALKATIIIFLFALLLPLQDYRLLTITAGVIMAYIRFDLRGLVMLGDSGSNTLGMIAGLVLLQAGAVVKTVLVILLVLVHAVSEKYSFSKIIEGNTWLKKIDEWGR